jgi:Zn-dependent protease with chaperone function
LPRGLFFAAGTTRHVPARLQATGDALSVTGEDGVLLAAAPRGLAQISSRLGALPRRVVFPGQGTFETPDNDAIDGLIQGAHGWLYRLETSWPAIATAVLCAVAAATWFIFYGTPMTAAALARATPPQISRFMTSQALATLDGRLLHPTKLTPAQQQNFQARFAAIAEHRDRYVLLLRNAPIIGPNAFALPDGRIVLTDQLAAMIRNNQEIDGVFAHEMSHVNHAHVLQRVYQVSLVPAAIAFVTGDATQISHFASILPGILLQSAYSRQFEQEADDDAAATLRRRSENPARLADLLERMARALCHGQDCTPGWLGSHPATSVRAARLRRKPAQ